MAFHSYGQPASFQSYQPDLRVSGMPTGQTPSYYTGHSMGQTMGASPPGQMDTSGYLPPFLLGSPAPKSPSRLAGTHSSQRSTGLTPSVQGLRTAQTPRGTPMLEQSHLDGKMNGGLGTTGHGGNKAIGGPPVHGLYDHHPPTPSRGASTPMLTGSPERRQLNFSVVNSGQRSGLVSNLGSVSRPRANSTPGTVGGLNVTTNSLKQRTPPSPAQMDPFYTQGETLTSEDDYPDCWVTVFGFPSTASSYILEQFSQYGTILKHVVSSNGNWMHIMYQSRLQAKKALSKNGKVYGNGIMVGVQPCIDKSVIEGYSKAASLSDHSTTLPDTISSCSSINPNSTPSKKPTSIRPLTAAYQASASQHQSVIEGYSTASSLSDHSTTLPDTISSCSSINPNSTPSKKPTSIRPLTAAYQASASQHQVAPSNPNTPQKSSGFFSKAFEYMFGW